MNERFAGRWTAQTDSDFVVFLIGMRVNQPLAVKKWWPVSQAMPRMQRELAARPELGCLHTQNWFGRTTISVQYWRDFESLRAYAANADLAHLPAWKTFNRAARDNESVGIWHETYQVRQGAAEAIYGNMPRFGLAAAHTHTRASTVGNSAAKRIGARTDDITTVEPY